MVRGCGGRDYWVDRCVWPLEGVLHDYVEYGSGLRL